MHFTSQPSTSVGVLQIRSYDAAGSSEAGLMSRLALPAFLSPFLMLGSFDKSLLAILRPSEHIDRLRPDFQFSFEKG